VSRKSDGSLFMKNKRKKILFRLLALLRSNFIRRFSYVLSFVFKGICHDLVTIATNYYSTNYWVV